MKEKKTRKNVSLTIHMYRRKKKQKMGVCVNSLLLPSLLELIYENNICNKHLYKSNKKTKHFSLRTDTRKRNKN